ncbi:MAG: PqqD family protein [Muribaculaceae bacterium]|nr:PqqD family protein [Muribaculaceae bacterium]
MKKINGFAMRRLGQDAMIVAESVDLIDFDKIVSLNSSAAYIWESLPDNDFSTRTITDLLMQRYNVEEKIASKDAEDLVNLWIKAGIIKE